MSQDYLGKEEIFILKFLLSRENPTPSVYLEIKDQNKKHLKLIMLIQNKLQMGKKSNPYAVMEVIFLSVQITT